MDNIKEDEKNPKAEWNKMKSNSSVIFRRNRAIGYVSNHIPAVVRYAPRRKDTFIVTCIGRAFQIYTASHFRLWHVSDQHPDEITAMAMDKLHIFTACGNSIYAWRAGKHIQHIYHNRSKSVHLLLPFGAHFISVDEENILKVWSVMEEYIHLEIPFNSDEFEITAIAHPPTYINKIVVGSKQGSLQIWNINNNRLIYTFTGHPSRITCIEPSPALDVVAVGHQDGYIALLNLKYDEILMDFHQDWGKITNITFRTDGPPIMATSCTNGYMAFWNLEEKKVDNQLQVHDDSVATAICLPNEPLLLTTSPDNSMKLWIFDMPGGAARLLRIRDGNPLPPLCIRFHGSNGSTILTSGEDSTLRAFSTISETFNRSFGKASFNRKSSKKKKSKKPDAHRMPPIIEFTSETTREKEWDNIACIHMGCVQTTTWSFNQKRMGEYQLIPKKFLNANRIDYSDYATCVLLTHCGNYTLIGYSSGDVERFNIQSGQHRCSYGDPAHKSAVRGLATDSINRLVVTGCSSGFLKFWPFKNAVSKPRATMKLKYGITLIRCHRESNMIAVCLANFMILVIDLDTKAIIRKFVGHLAKLNDLTFSPDSRYIISASMDATIKVWDIPSSYMIDHFRVEQPCTSLTMSPNGNFLATAHANCLGIYLWANKMLFSQISLRQIDPFSEAPLVCLPSNNLNKVSGEESSENIDMEIDESEVVGDEINFKYKTPEQLSNDLVTMSGEAISRWQNLLDLEIIKKRNKPKEPPKVPKQAPFFLPTVAGLEFKFDVEPKPLESDNNSRIIKANNFCNLTKFGKLLAAAQIPADYDNCVLQLKSFGPSMIDFEVKSLHPLNGGSNKVMVQFLHVLKFMYESNKYFELAQSYLSVFLRVHGLELAETPDVIEALKELSAIQETSWQKLEEKIFFCLGALTCLRNFVD